jgi:Holliday junction resolvasome RuvABC DNA-binding subunit
MDDLVSALLNMGYKQPQVDKVVGLLRPDVEAGTGLGELVRLALQKLTRADR